MGVVWGILSTARINRLVVPACAGSDLVEFRAVASRSYARAQAFAEQYGLRRPYASYVALLADPDVTAVYVSLPNALHLEWSRKALEAGKHVLCEKPLGQRPADVAAAFELAEARGLVFAEAFMYRHHPQTARMIDVVSEGVIGELRFVRATLSFALDFRGQDVRLDPTLGGGALMDVGCYCVSAARLLCGEPVSVFGEQFTDGTEVDTRFIGTMLFPGGTSAQFDCAMTLPRRDCLEVVGTEGTLIVPDPWHCRTESFSLQTGKGHDDRSSCAIPVDPGGTLGLRYRLHDAYRLEFEAFSRAVSQGHPMQHKREDAIAQARALQALATSAQAGSPVVL